MNFNRLHAILNETTTQLRKGAPIEERETAGMRVAEVFAMPHESEADPDLDKVDVVFVTIGVDRKKAETRRVELIDLLRQYPQPERLAAGPSYIEVGAEIGDQGAAFQLFALGQTLGLWKIITPAVFGFEGEEARQMAGQGLLMISGFGDRQKLAAPTTQKDAVAP